MKYNLLLIIVILVSILSCSKKMNKKLPIYGRKEIKKIKINEETLFDTIEHTISNFSFINQEGNIVNNQTFKGSIYVADFFFTSCPTICPIMKNNLLDVYQYFEGNDEVKFLSHTINPIYDNVERLKSYSKKLDVNSNIWHFVTGDIENIYDLAKKSYMVSALEDSNEPGGFLHSGTFLLVDKKRRIRGIYDGTDKSEMKKLINDIKTLLSI